MPKAPRTAEVARRLVDAYVTSLRQHLPTYCIRQLDKLPGAQEHQLTRLRQSYPGAPTELLYFLQRVNGTCWESLVAPRKAPTHSPISSSASSSAPPPPPPPPTSTAAAASSASSPATASPTAASAASPAVDGAANASGQKSGAKATAAAAAAFIKSRIVKKVTGGSAKPRRMPHYVALPILGSTYTGCPYYLKSVEQMLLAEQQFPPPSANLPDEGECWTPPSQSQSQQQQPSSATPATAPGDSATATVTSSSTGAAAQDREPPSLAEAAAAAASAQLNQNTIASVFAGYKIVYGPPPSLEGKTAVATAAAAEMAKTAAPATAATSAAPLDLASLSLTAEQAKAEDETRVVFVDPRIDVNANFYHWLVFADSVQPHVRGTVPVIPDADPAKVAAAAAAAAGGGGAEDGSGGKGAAVQLEKAKGVPLTAPSASKTAAAAAAAQPPKFFAASRLYIDFKPVEEKGGVYGQVIQFVHGQPDSFTVVANDFGSYLKHVMSEEYDFTEELEDDEDDEDDDEPEEKPTKKAAPTANHQ